MARAHGAGAASVVTQLLAFLREPARHRHHYTHGRGTLEGGHHVFKFAQGRFPQGLMHDTSTGARDELRQAAEAFVRQVCFREGSTHYQLLCVAPQANRESIKENYRLAIALIHPDRSEGSEAVWPAEWAQRANRAYEVLSDDARRAAYDASLRAFDSVPPFAAREARMHAHVPGSRVPKRSPAGLRIARALVVLSAVVATLLLLEVWLGDTRRDYALFHGITFPRIEGSSSDKPRYIGVGASASRGERRETAAPSNEESAFSLLAPLWRGLTSPGAASVAPPPLPRVEPAPQADVAPPKPVIPVVAPAVAAVPAAAANALTSQDIEMVVARLIGYWEAGETDQLMALLDTREGGFWRNARIRQSYLEFFRATKQRRLRLDNLDWQTAPGAASARGAATVHAEYLDEPGRLERRIEVEMDIALRDGKARITRLALYPNAP